MRNINYNRALTIELCVPLAAAAAGLCCNWIGDSSSATYRTELYACVSETAGSHDQEVECLSCHEPHLGICISSFVFKCMISSERNMRETPWTHQMDCYSCHRYLENLLPLIGCLRPITGSLSPPYYLLTHMQSTCSSSHLPSLLRLWRGEALCRRRTA